MTRSEKRSVRGTLVILMIPILLSLSPCNSLFPSPTPIATEATAISTSTQTPTTISTITSTPTVTATATTFPTATLTLTAIPTSSAEFLGNIERSPMGDDFLEFVELVAISLEEEPFTLFTVTSELPPDAEVFIHFGVLNGTDYYVSETLFCDSDAGECTDALVLVRYEDVPQFVHAYLDGTGELGGEYTLGVLRSGESTRNRSPDQYSWEETREAYLIAVEILLKYGGLIKTVDEVIEFAKALDCVTGYISDSPGARVTLLPIAETTAKLLAGVFFGVVPPYSGDLPSC